MGATPTLEAELAKKKAAERPARRLENFTPTEEVGAYLDKMQEEGHTRADTMRDSIIFQRDVRDAMGDELWFEAFKRSMVRRVSLGVVIGELAAQKLQNGAGKK
jgi:hypothetical protein